MLCQRTSIAGNPLLANSLLSWVALALVTKTITPVDGKHYHVSENASRATYLTCLLYAVSRWYVK